MTEKSLKEYCRHDKLSKTDSFGSTGDNQSLFRTRICNIFIHMSILCFEKTSDYE